MAAATVAATAALMPNAGSTTVIELRMMAAVAVVSSFPRMVNDEDGIIAPAISPAPTPTI